MSSPPYVYRSRTALVLAVAIMALAAAALVNLATGGWAVVWRWGAVPLWLALTVWGLFGAPRVLVDQAGVTLVNPANTVYLEWGAIRRIDTRWALTLFTARGKVTAFAAPAPSNFSIHRARPADLKGLPESTYVADSIRPGDLPQSPSGHVALVVRRHWEALRDAGELGSPEDATHSVTWHKWGLGLWLALGVAAVVLVRVGM